MVKQKKRTTLEPFSELSQYTVDEASVRLLSYRFSKQSFVVVLGKVEPGGTDPVTVGMLDVRDADLIATVSRALGRPVKPVQLNAYEIQTVLDRAHSKSDGEDKAFRLRPVERFSYAPDGATSTLLEEIFGRAVSMGASDIHVEVYEADVDVRFRVDGVLHQVTTPLGPGNLRRTVARIKILAQLDIAETRSAQEGRIYATYDDAGHVRPIDLRVSILPGPFGEDVVLRILDSSSQLLELGRLGLAPWLLEGLKEIVESPEGFVLVTGPTGSGKTTTLYSLLNSLHIAENKILTVEDPIEYRFPKINQKQVTRWMGFADYARAFMRQDPDVIMIGEIRDEETAQLALRAAQTGHLVLSSVHAHDSIGTLARLKTLGLEPADVSETLLGVIAQRLVRKVCPSCRAPHTPDPPEARMLARLGVGFPTFAGKGCAECLMTGMAGRTAVFEVFVPDPELIELIAADAQLEQVRAAARKKGMRLLVEDAFAKVQAGVTSVAEVRRVISHRLLRSYRPA